MPNKPKTNIIDPGFRKILTISGWSVYISRMEVTTQKGSTQYHFTSLKSALLDLIDVITNERFNKEEDMELKKMVKILKDTQEGLWKEISDKIDERFPSGKIGKYEI